MKEYATTTLVVSQPTSRAQLSSNTAEQRKTHDTERREAGQHSKIAPFQIPDPSFRVVRGACLGRRLVAREGERKSEKESVERCFRALNLRRRNKGKKKRLFWFRAERAIPSHHVAHVFRWYFNANTSSSSSPCSVKLFHVANL